MTEQNQSASGRRGSGKKRRHRSRPMPRNLTAQDLDEIGRRRCLMILEVLSGRVPVTDAIAAAKISRGTYYQLEALAAMLTALSPSSSDSSTSSASKEVEALQARVDKLETDKRRLERLLQLATKVVKPGPLTTGKGRPPKPKPKTKLGRGSTKNGRAASPDSPTPVKPMKSPSRRSTPKPSAVEP